MPIPKDRLEFKLTGHGAVYLFLSDHRDYAFSEAELLEMGFTMSDIAPYCLGIASGQITGRGGSVVLYEPGTKFYGLQ